MSVDAEINDEFIDAWLEFIDDDDRVTNDPMEAHYIGFKMWVEAVNKAGTTDASAVQDAIIGVTVPNLSGGMATMMPNHHITKPVLIGEIQADGQFDIVWETPGTVVGDAWTDHLEGSRDITADWMKPLACGNYNVKTGTCSGQNYE
jgi:urea transport system substrate-binding protein